jgi:hypothetical protein
VFKNHILKNSILEKLLNSDIDVKGTVSQNGDKNYPMEQ